MKISKNYFNKMKALLLPNIPKKNQVNIFKNKGDISILKREWR